MVEISNLCKYEREGLVRLEADINFTDMDSPYSEKTLYFEIDKRFSYMLAADTYDAFVLVPLWLAMYHKQDLHICGNISKKLYQNIKWYIQKILCDFSDDLAPVNVTVDGFNPPKPKGSLIGTGISCGVDSLSTIYDHFINEEDPDYKINSLFLFDCGTHGDFEDPQSHELFLSRYRRNVNAANELGLPVYLVNSNLHAFTHKIGEQKMGYFAIYSCIFSLQNVIFRYYTSSTFSYREIKNFEEYSRERDVAEFSESYLVPLIQTDNLELIVDGCQYRRVDKLKKIVEWDIAQKYLNVCFRHVEDAANCGVCSKCLRTLLPLEIMGKLDDFAQVFDVERYKTRSLWYKSRCVHSCEHEPFETENSKFADENNFPMPTKVEGFLLDGKVLFL